MPAVLFNLWNPYHADDGTFTFEVTQADTFRIQRGTREFVDAALRAFGVSIDDYSWDIVTGRAFYYSDDQEKASWRDRWPETWRFRITPSAPIEPHTNTLFSVPVDQTLSDNSRRESGGDTRGDDGDEMGDDERQRHTAFVIVDFQRSPAGLEKMIHDLIGRWKPSLEPFEPAFRKLEQGFRQVQLVARDIDLAVDAPALEELLSELQSKGGVVNWHSRMTWSTRPAEAVLPEISAWLDSLGPLMKKDS